MKFEQLIALIEETSQGLQRKALSSINRLLVIRNWLIGYYIVEFEQKGDDRARYGRRLLNTLAEALEKKKLKGFSMTNLKLFRMFYLNYPQIGQPVADQLSAQNIQPPLKLAGSPKGLPAADQFSPKNDFSIDPQILLQQFSFRHFTELIKIKDPLKRTFYEQQAIKGNWSSRQLKRQIGSLLLERTGLSKNKEALIQSVQNQQALTSIEDTIKDPYVLEFTGFKELPTYSETDLETSLLDKIQDFLIELGHGFCFEARQKRITIGNEHDRVDLVF
jgi:predicted nuclease of restriction endonuclease-like (RecB) superfamily